MDRRVMVILAEGFEEGETTTIIDVLRRAGFETHAVSLTGELVTGAHGMRLMADRILDSEGFRDYDMIVLPGGWGAADNMAADSRLTELLRWYAAQPEKCCSGGTGKGGNHRRKDGDLLSRPQAGASL